jgi:hypothetical protein
MATMTFYSSFNMNSPIDLGEWVPAYNTGTQLAMTDGNYNYLFSGTGLTYDADYDLNGGTLTGIGFADAIWGQAIFSATGLNTNLAAMPDYYQIGYDTNGDGTGDIWGTQAGQSHECQCRGPLEIIVYVQGVA